MRVRKVAKDGKMKAVVSITLDDEFVVHDIKVIEGEKGLFIAMPSRKASDGEYRDIATRLTLRPESAFRLSFWSSMKKRLQSLPRRRKQQSSFKREQIPETEKRTGRYRRKLQLCISAVSFCVFILDNTWELCYGDIVGTVLFIQRLRQSAG